MNYTIREIKTSEYPLLDDFLYEAIYVPKDAVPPPRAFLIYLKSEQPCHCKVLASYST